MTSVPRSGTLRPMITSIYVPDPLHALVTRLAALRDRSPSQLMVDLVLHTVATDPGSPCRVVLDRLTIDGPLSAGELQARTGMPVDEVLLVLQVLAHRHGKRSPYIVEEPDAGRPGLTVFRIVEDTP